jgi:hypothetical protein
MLLEMLYMLRWAGGTWMRYWIAAYAVGLPASVVLIERWVRRRPWAAGLAILAVAAMAYPPLDEMIGRVEWAANGPRTEAQRDEPYAEVTPLLRPGTRTLLVCSRATRDYGLFLPRRGYTAAVIPWGKHQPDRERLERLIDEERVTHVLFEHDWAVGFHWDPTIKTAEMVRWMAAREDFREIPLSTPNMRLFERFR